jgi:cytochrome c biogenesis protein CcmG, thiol:disulfide interchange protein DsbE
MNWRRWWPVLAIGAFATAAVLVLTGLGSQMFPVEVGSTAPPFRAKHLARGDTVALADYRGKVVLVNIWATWCLPCRVEMPSLERLHRQFNDSGLVILAVSVDRDDESVITDFTRELGLTFEILHDAEGGIQQVYQTTGVPESFVIDKNGVIQKLVIGAMDWDSPGNQAFIRRLLAQGPSD